MNDACANAVTSFTKDAEDFKKVSDSLSEQRDIFQKFHILSLSYQDAYLPLAFFLKRIGKYCRREQKKLDERIEVITDICKTYDSIINELRVSGWENEKRAITARMLDMLGTMLKRHRGPAGHWHHLLREKLLNMDSAYNNVRSLRIHFH